MKIGQMVMLVARNDTLPPTGATGEIAQECCVAVNVRVKFAHHTCKYSEDGLYCTPRRWLVPIDEPGAFKGEEEKTEVQYSDRAKERIEDLQRLLREKHRELEKVR